VLSFFKRRAFVLLIGFVLIALFIWYAGPYFAFGNYRPLDTETARLVAIALVLGIWLVWSLLKWLRVGRATDKLVSAVLSQTHPEKERVSPEAAKLREAADKKRAADEQAAEARAKALAQANAGFERLSQQEREKALAAGFAYLSALVEARTKETGPVWLQGAGVLERFENYLGSGTNFLYVQTSLS